MRSTRAILMAMILAATSMAGTAAWADRGYRGGYGYPEYRHHGPGLALGAGLLLGSALIWAATRPPPVIYAPSAPVYVTPDPEPMVVMPPRPVASNGDWWYYCRAVGAYYPYVQSCPTGWERVPPRPGAW